MPSLSQTGGAGGGASGTEYTEGDTDSTITGQAMLWEDAADTLRVVSAAKPLPVELAAATLAALETIGLDATTLAALESITIGTALPAGSNAIGKLAANSGVDIGDVDVTSSALPTGASTAAKQDTMIGHLDGVEAALAAVQTAVEILDNAIAGSEIQADVLTLPSIPAGNNNIGDVDVASSALPSGASTAAKQDTAQTALDAIKTATELIDNTVAGSELQVDVVGALPAGNNNVGDVDVASIAAGDNNIGNVDVVTLPALVAGSAAIGKLAANSGVDIGDVDVLSIAAGTNAIGNIGVIPRTSGGLDTFRSLDLDETEEEVKATAGQVFGWYIYNDGAAEAYVKLYNATAANVTVGTTTPTHTIPIPAGSAANVFGEIGITFGTAITAAATTGVADADTAAPAANQVVANLFYK